MPIPANQPPVADYSGPIQFPTVFGSDLRVEVNRFAVFPQIGVLTSGASRLFVKDSEGPDDGSRVTDVVGIAIAASFLRQK